MARNKKDFLARKILLGVMAASVLYGGIFVSLAEAAEEGDVVFHESTTAGSAEACNNTETITSGSWSNDYGTDKKFVVGLSYNAEASGNTLIFDKSVSILHGTMGLQYNIWGGYAAFLSGNVNNNTIKITDISSSSTTGTFEIENMSAGQSSLGYANGNTIDISGGNFTNSKGSVVNIVGGSGWLGAKNNTVIINGGNFDKTLLYGSKYYYTRDAKTEIKGNKVIINSGTFNGVYGGAAELITALGDSSGSFAINGNTVVINDGHIVRDVYGGYVGLLDSGDTGAASITVNDNSVILNGGIVEGNVIGGYAKGNNLVADNNSITLGNADDKGGVATVKGSVIPRWIFNTSTSANERFGGTINVYNSGNSIKTLYAGAGNLNFFINSEDMNQAGSNTMLTVEDIAYIPDTTVNAGVRNAGSIKKDDKIILLSASRIMGDAASYSNMKASDGIMEAELEIVKDENKIIATALQDAKASSKEESAAKSPVETMAASISLLNSGSDMLAGESMSRAAEAANGSGMSPFASIGGSSLKIKSGSHVDMKSWNINVGLAKEVENKNGKLLFGPVIEYGRGSYDSYLDNGAHGNGKSSFYGIGMIAKQSYNNGVYIDGSIRLGKAKSDYSSTAIGGGVNYDTSATYYAMHTGVGKIVDINEKDSIDYYGKLFYSHQNGSSAQVGAYTYDFKAVDSFRTRLGFRYNHKLTEVNSLYAGLAWQHEFSSKCEAVIHNGGNSMEAPAPSIKGDSGIIELGWRMNPAENGRFEMDLGLTGYVGKQQGVGANVNFLWHF